MFFHPPCAIVMVTFKYFLRVLAMWCLLRILNMWCFAYFFSLKLLRHSLKHETFATQFSVFRSTMVWLTLLYIVKLKTIDKGRSKVAATFSHFHDLNFSEEVLGS